MAIGALGAGEDSEETVVGVEGRPRRRVGVWLDGGAAGCGGWEAEDWGFGALRDRGGSGVEGR